MSQIPSHQVQIIERLDTLANDLAGRESEQKVVMDAATYIEDRSVELDDLRAEIDRQDIVAHERMAELEQLRSRLDEVEKANAEASGRMKGLMLLAPPISTKWQQTINACINILELKNPPESGSEVRG